MVHFCKVPFIQVGILLVFTCFITYSAGSVVSLEELKLELKELKTELEEKNFRLEEKVTQLEIKNTQLENKVQQQEGILTTLLHQLNQPVTLTGSKSISNLQTASTGRSGIPRTCRELRAANPSLSSGMHWIDPDGQGVGESPIYVYCDMLSGSTSILHDSESPIDVGHCTDPGCYSRFINYNASIKQIKSLIELSAECHQSIKYDCYYAPFEFGNIAYSWWNNRDGEAQYVWAGNNVTGIHTCQCGIDGNCVDNTLKCNCDIAAPIQLADEGVITNKNVLPVTKLNFGRTLLETSSGIHTLGRFECTGTVPITGLPTSCKDLWVIGHTMNGFYSVMGPVKMESVYCDFTKLPDEAEFQKWIGYTDIKSAPVHFYVQRNSSFSTTQTPIPFELSWVNEGNAMDLTSGIFTGPRTGTYFFSFTGSALFPPLSGYVRLGVSLYLNGNIIGKAFVQDTNTSVTHWYPLTIQSTLNLKSGDKVWVQIDFWSTGTYLFDDSNHYTHFTGFMMEEEIVASL